MHDVLWPQGSKTILQVRTFGFFTPVELDKKLNKHCLDDQAVMGDQHLDIKHGHRFIKDHVLGYEFEMQRLIAFERQAHMLVGHWNNPGTIQST